MAKGFTTATTSKWKFEWVSVNGNQIGLVRDLKSHWDAKLCVFVPAGFFSSFVSLFFGCLGVHCLTFELVMHGWQKYPVRQLRPWPFHCRQNHTYRPTMIDLEADINKTVSHLPPSPCTSLVTEHKHRQHSQLNGKQPVFMVVWLALYKSRPCH